MSRRDPILPAVAAALALCLAAQVAVALTLRVEGYDGYWYLSNAWYLAGGSVSSYEITKAPLLSLLFLPLMVLRRLGLPEVWVFVGCHLVSVGLTLATGVLLARLLALRFAPALAWAGAFAFLASRIVFRYGAFAMSDLPSTLFVLAALLCVHQARHAGGWRARVPFALAAAAAILARYPSALVLPVAALWDAGQVVARTGRGGRAAAAASRLASHAVAGLVCGGTVAAVHLAVYAVPFGGPSGIAAAFAEMVERNVRLGGIAVRGLEPWWEYGPVLVRACTWPVALLMVLGLAVGLRRGSSLEWLHALWATAHLAFISAVSSHKEARYLLPAIPSLYLFALWGMRGAGRSLLLRLGGAAAPAPRWARGLAAALLLGAGLLTLAREGTMLAQPFFRTPHVGRLAAALDREIPAPGRIAWAGNFYPLWPPRYVFDRRDEYYYVYHLAPHVLEYVSGRQIISLRGLPTGQMDGNLYPLGAAVILGDGDGLISSVPGITVTATLRPDLPPLGLSRTRGWDLLPQATESGRREEIWSAATDPVRARALSPRELELTGYPGPSEVMVRRRDGETVSLGLMNLAGGAARLELPPGWRVEQVGGLRLLRYTPVPLEGAW